MTCFPAVTSPSAVSVFCFHSAAQFPLPLNPPFSLLSLLPGTAAAGSPWTLTSVSAPLTHFPQGDLFDINKYDDNPLPPRYPWFLLWVELCPGKGVFKSWPLAPLSVTLFEKGPLAYVIKMYVKGVHMGVGAALHPV